MKRIVKFFLAAIIILAAAGAVIYAMNMPISVPLTMVQPGVAELSFSEQGVVVADNIVQVYPIAQGRLLRTHVDKGSIVRTGDVLCEIDAEPIALRIPQINSVIEGYQAQIANIDLEQERAANELSSSKNRLLGEIAALEAQQRSSDEALNAQNVSVEEQLRLQGILIEQRESELLRARDELSKATVLYNAGSLPRSDYEAALDAVAGCETALEAGKQELVVISGGTGRSNEEYYSGMRDALQAQIAGIDHALSTNYTGAMRRYYEALINSERANISQLENEMANCVVIAPVDGVISEFFASSTNFVSPAAPIAEITSQNDAMVEVYVSTKDIDSVRPGDYVLLTLKRREQDVTFDGEVAEIDTSAEVRFSALGVEDRKVKVRILPKLESLPANTSFGLGYSSDVKFYLYYEEDKLTVPKTALFKDGEDDMLWLVRGETLEAISVITGVELRTETVIESGLSSGDYVVTDANNKDLKNGVKIAND